MCNELGAVGRQMKCTYRIYSNRGTRWKDQILRRTNILLVLQTTVLMILDMKRTLNVYCATLIGWKSVTQKFTQDIDSMWQNLTLQMSSWNFFYFLPKQGVASTREGASIRINTVFHLKCAHFLEIRDKKILISYDNSLVSFVCCC